MNNLTYAACQNGVILEVFNTEEEAISRVKKEIERDFISIILRKKLRKIMKKSGNVALHKYTVMKILEVKEIK